MYDLIKPELNELSIKMGRDKLHKLLRDSNLLIKKKKNYHTTTNSNHHYKKHKNLIKELDIKRPEQVWVTDITYIKSDNENLYLTLITDAYSKKIMGYNLANNMRAEESLKALKMAIKNREKPNSLLIHHSDRGVQFCSNEYVNHLVKSNIKISMTEKYDPYENAIAERINGILKDEFDIADGFINHLHATKEIKASINIYNEIRPHLSCQLMTPNNAHKTGKFKRKIWGKSKPIL